MNPAAADHLAEIDRRFEDHIEALRARSAAAKDQVEHGVTALATMVDPAPFEASPSFAPPPNPFAANALIPDTPLVGSAYDHGSTAEDDGILLWQD